MTALSIAGDDGRVEWEPVGDTDRDGLNVALNEATWFGLNLDVQARRASLLLSVLSLPADGPAPANTPVIVTLEGVSRIAASLRNGWWNEEDAEVVPLGLEDLETVVRSFGGCQIYGWEFLDPPEESWAYWQRRCSLDVQFGEQASPHVVEVFQAGGAPDRHLDLRVWFNRIAIGTREGRQITLVDFIAGGLRWWDALAAGDPRTHGAGIYPVRTRRLSRWKHLRSRIWGAPRSRP